MSANHDLSRQARRCFRAWLALLALMLASLASAYLPLGIFNPIASIGIAVVKASIVVALFMRLLQATSMVRIAAATALGTGLLLFALSGVDYATRPREPAPYQPPQQTPALDAAKSFP